MFLKSRRASHLGRVQSSEALAGAGGPPRVGLGRPGFPGLRDAKFRATLTRAWAAHGVLPPLTFQVLWQGAQSPRFPSVLH